MKNYDDFKEFYSEELLVDLLELETARKNLLTKSAVAIIITLIVSSILPWFCADLFEIVIILWILCGGMCVWQLHSYSRDYRHNFKQSLIKSLIKFMDPNLQYAPEGSIDLYTFQRAEIFQRYANEFDGEDLVCGMIDKTKIQFSEFKARYEDEDSQLDENSARGFPYILGFKLFIKCFINRNIFKGLFFVADFNKTFHGQVLVMPDKMEKHFGRFGQMMQSHNLIRGELMKMDNTEFERHFVVYGSDQIQSRYVLTPALMDKIINFKNKTGDSVCLSFKDSMLYIAVPCKRNLFEPKYFKNVIHYIDTFQYFQDLRLFIGIAEEFNLNTRIWTKE